VGLPGLSCRSVAESWVGSFSQWRTLPRVLWQSCGPCARSGLLRRGCWSMFWASSLEERGRPRDRTWKKKSKQSNTGPPNVLKKKWISRVIQTGDGNNFASGNRLGPSLLGTVGIRNSLGGPTPTPRTPECQCWKIVSPTCEIISTETWLSRSTLDANYLQH